jgi:thiol:disulfide interchange protein
VSSNLTLSACPLFDMSARCVDCLNEAIERCEVTGVPLCAEHLWYAEDGRRISERVARQLEARGETVTSPQHYLTQLGGAMALPRLPVSPQPILTLQRNGNDIVALLALIAGVISLATCFGVGIALCLPPLPILPLILGVIGLAGAKNATRPAQARAFSTVGVVAGAGFAIIMLGFVLITALAGAGSLLPTLYAPGPAPTVVPTLTPGP